MPIFRILLVSAAAVATWVSASVPSVAGPGRPDAPTARAERIVTLGKVTVSPERARRLLGPVAAYVARHLDDLGINGIQLLFAPNNAAMADHLRAGRVDWVSETAASASAFVENATAEVIARRWIEGAPEYQTIIVARRDSDILHLADLAGKTVAFESPGSTESYYIPAHALLQAGLTLKPAGAPDTLTNNGAVRFLFSHDKLVTSAWVHTGKVDAGALSNRDWRSDKVLPPAYRAKLRIIYTSGKFPYALELVRRDLDNNIKARIREALLGAHGTRRGRAALRAYNRTARFDAAPAKVTRSIAELRDIRNTVRAKLP